MKLFFRTASRRGRGALAPGHYLRRVAVWAAAGLLALAFAGPLGAQSISTERMFEAVMKDDLAAVKRQVEAGAEIRWRNPRGLTAAEFAVELGHIEIANYLLAEEKARASAPPRVADKGAPKAAKKSEPSPVPRPDAGAARAQRAPQTLVERLANLMRTDEPEPGPEPARAGTETSPPPPAPGAPAAQESLDDGLSPAERIAERVRERQEAEKKARAAAPAPTEERRPTRSRTVVEWLADLWAGREPREVTRPRSLEELAASEDARRGAPPPPDRPTPGVRDPWSPQVSPATPSIAPAPDGPAPEIPPADTTAPESPAPQPPAPTALAALPPPAASPAPPSGTPPPDAPAGAWAPTIERGGEAQAAPSEAPTAGPQDAPTLFARRKDGPATKKDAAKELGAPATGAQQTARLGEPKKSPAGATPPAKPPVGEGGPDEGGLWGSKVEMAQARPVVTAPPAAPPVPEAVPTGLGFMVGRSLNLDKAVPPRGDAQEAGRGCIEKARGAVVFCVEVANWPQAMETDFTVNTILYTGQQAVVRYDRDKATRMQTLFPSDSFDKVVAYYSGLYGPPAEYFTRSIAPLASARRENPTRAWRARNPKTGQIATLEIRKFDDTRGGFPDTRRGVVMLYYQDTPPIFPQVSALELMRLKRPSIPKPEEGGDDQGGGLFGLPGTTPGPAARAQ